MWTWRPWYLETDSKELNIEEFRGIIEKVSFPRQSQIKKIISNHPSFKRFIEKNPTRIKKDWLWDNWDPDNWDLDYWYSDFCDFENAEVLYFILCFEL